MTPSELHAIYKPAWDVCPECRPRTVHHGRRFVMMLGAFDTEEGRKYEAHTWTRDDGIAPHLPMTTHQTPIEQEAAAALCFEAAWVWLAKYNYESVAIQPSSGPTQTYWLYGKDAYPTHHHAVVAAVVSVCRGEKP